MWRLQRASASDLDQIPQDHLLPQQTSLCNEAPRLLRKCRLCPRRPVAGCCSASLGKGRSASYRLETFQCRSVYCAVQDRLPSAPPRRALLQWDSREARSAKAALPDIRSCRNARIFSWASSWVRVTVGSFQEDGRLTSLSNLQLLRRCQLSHCNPCSGWHMVVLNGQVQR